MWLGSNESRDITGKVFEVEGGKIRVARVGARTADRQGARWDPAELGPVVADLLAKSRPPVPVYGADPSCSDCLCISTGIPDD